MQKRAKKYNNVTPKIQRNPSEFCQMIKDWFVGYITLYYELNEKCVEMGTLVSASDRYKES